MNLKMNEIRKWNSEKWTKLNKLKMNDINWLNWKMNEMRKYLRT
jgi:hypothetical protein